MIIKLLSKYANNNRVKKTTFWAGYIFELIVLAAFFTVIVFDFILGVL